MKKLIFCFANILYGIGSTGYGASLITSPGITADRYIPRLKRIKNCNIITMITASFAKNIVAKCCGVVCHCFQVLFLNSSCVIKLAESIIPRGINKIAIDSQEFIQCFSQKSAEELISFRLLCLYNLIIIIMQGVKNAPITTSQDARLRFFLSHSD